jgi:hypothetical protein
MKRRFNIEIRDYEQGEDPAVLTADAVESAVRQLLDSEGGDGIVIVSEEGA